MTIYLAGPMLDHTGDFKHPEAQTWREEIAAEIPTGVLLVSPAHAFFGASPITAQALDYMERHMIHAADGVLVNLLTEEPAFGTIRDIEFARSHGRPVAVAGDVRSLMAHDIMVEPSVELALLALIHAIRQEQDTPPMLPFGVMLRRPDDEE